MKTRADALKRERVILFGFLTDNQSQKNVKSINNKLEKFCIDLKKQSRSHKLIKNSYNISHFLDESNESADLRYEDLLSLSAWKKFQVLYIKNYGIWDITKPLYVDDWTTLKTMRSKKHVLNIKRKPEKFNYEELPLWKQHYLEFNSKFYEDNKELCVKWIKENNVLGFSKRGRILEWQAGQDFKIEECLIQFRQSGIRVKRPNYTPTLVAINQTPILGKKISKNGKYRKMTVRECSNLQAFPENFKFGDQSDESSYKQIGNAVNTNVIYWTFKKFIDEFKEEIICSQPNLKHMVERIQKLSKNADNIDWQTNSKQRKEV